MKSGAAKAGAVSRARVRRSFTYRVAGEVYVVYVNGTVEWVLLLRGFFTPPPQPSPASQGRGDSAGIRVEVVVFGGRRCAKAHAMVGFTYT